MSAKKSTTPSPEQEDVSADAGTDEVSIDLRRSKVVPSAPPGGKGTSMSKPFNETEFRQRLVDRGTDPDMATDIASKTAASRNLQLQKEREEVPAWNANPRRGPAAVGRLLPRSGLPAAPAGAPSTRAPLADTQSEAPPRPATPKRRAKPSAAPKDAAATTARKAAGSKGKPKGTVPVPDTAFSNRQLSLFQSFLANDDAQRDILSNAIDLWDSIPRYSLSRRRQDELRQPGGYLPIRKITFQYRGIPLTAVIRPARLELRDEQGRPTGGTVEYYPSAREELIEYALRRLATEKPSGFFDESQPRSGVYFTLYRLRQELAAQGHSMTHRDLAEGLDILSLGGLDIETESDHDALGVRKFGRASFIVNLAGVKREDLDRNPNARWYVEFHPFVTASIDKIAYRQFNYHRWMQCRGQLGRWLISQLVLKYTQAAQATSFTMKYSTIKRDSGLLDGYKLPRQAVAALDEAWEELKERGVLASYKKEEERGARAKLEDVSYTLLPTRTFAMEQRAANKRQLDAKAAIDPHQETLL